MAHETLHFLVPVLSLDYAALAILAAWLILEHPLPRGLCTGCPLCLECFSAQYLHGLLPV